MEMKRIAVFLALLILVPFVFADWFYNSQNIVANINIYSDAEVVPLTPSGYIDTATVNMTFFPKQTDTQELSRLYTNPQAELTGNSLEFTWKRPEGKIDFRFSADVKTANTINGVRQKISFPIQELPKDVMVYTKPSETIDSNDEAIIRIASDIVKGEDDLYAAVFKIAEWTKNSINYNLSTLTAEVSQKASWVLQNRQGVCDELTSLFIALLRSVGVPARFVSGISYTNSPLFPENWGAHGWAEVYFPGYGWVPFDVTYGEFGWVDPTHIKFKDSVDSDEPSTYYNWLGRNADLKTRKLEIKANLIEKTGYYKVPLNLEALPLKKAVGFGSYNLLEASIENLNDFYYATELRLSKPKELKIIGNEAKSILLLPKEKKKVFWILKLDNDMDSRYSYTFPLVVSTLNNITSETSFASNAREREVSFEEVEQTAKLLEEEKEKKYSGNVVLECRAGKDEFYEYEEINVHCNAKNTGNVFLDNAEICFEKKCSKISLGISQAANATFEINKSNIGFSEMPVTLRSDLVSKAAYVSFKINDVPKIEIEDLGFPINVSYDKNFTIYFTLAKKSLSNPKNIEIALMQNGIEKKWHIDELMEGRKFVLNFAGSQLKYGKNAYNINVNYYDGLKRQYNAGREFFMELSRATMVQRLLLFFGQLEISYKAIAITLTGAVAFIAVVLWLFRRSRNY